MRYLLFITITSPKRQDMHFFEDSGSKTSGSRVRNFPYLLIQLLQCEESAA